MSSSDTIILPSSRTDDSSTTSLTSSDCTYTDEEKGITIFRVNDYRPNEVMEKEKKKRPSDRDETKMIKKEYFTKIPDQTEEKNGIAGVIPFYNEPNESLQQTLISIQQSRAFLNFTKPEWKDRPFSMSVVMDGWVKAHTSMKEYCKKLFPAKINGTYWWDYFDEFKPTFDDSSSNATFIFQMKDHKKINITPQEYFRDDPMFMDLTLIIKINNRRKHNSHEWFMGHGGFGEAVNAEYLFYTDANTHFSRTCMYHLIDALDRDKGLCSATGRQRLMTREQQGTDESMFSLAFAYRMIQLHDFESAIALFYGAFALFGFLPVIPGPCGIYRAEFVLIDKVRDWYFDLVNSDPDKMSLALANLRIAEDRLLSYAPILKGVGSSAMKFVSLAVFYFEAELDLHQFVFQRRRWINGTVMGYIYMLRFLYEWLGCCSRPDTPSQGYEFLEWKGNPIRKFAVFFLMMCQVVTYLMVAIAPGISIRIVYFGIAYFLDYYNFHSGFEAKMIVGIALGALYLAHVWMHHSNKYVSWIWNTLIIQSVITSTLGIASLIHYAFWYEKQTIFSVIFSENQTVYLGIATIAGPFVLAFLLSGKGHSLMYMIKSYLPYLFLMPLVVTWFSAYSFVRFWDLSWGNRPANELSTVETDTREKITHKFRESNRIIYFGIFIANIIVFLIPLYAQIKIMEAYFAVTLVQVSLSLIYIMLQFTPRVRYAYIRVWSCKCCCCGRGAFIASIDNDDSDSQVPISDLDRRAVEETIDPSQTRAAREETASVTNH